MMTACFNLITMMKLSGCFGFVPETDVVLGRSGLPVLLPSSTKSIFRKTMASCQLMMKAILARLPNNDAIYDETGAHIEKN
jgi:hypothetical protein